MKTFFVSIAGVKEGIEQGTEVVSQVRNVVHDIQKGLNYILANKYDITMTDYNSLKIEIKDKNE